VFRIGIQKRINHLSLYLGQWGMGGRLLLFCSSLHPESRRMVFSQLSLYKILFTPKL